ncbi:MAG TPA: RsmE family RNA methyltransferase [Lentimicrobium sp.]|nr:RsmE family RNA methyltransferase [Lentimicrobium sp.]
MNLFYTDTNILEHFNQGRVELILPPDEATHLKVLRLKEGEEISVTDGIGHIGLGEVVENKKQNNLIQLKDVRSIIHPAWYIHVAVAPTKNIARFEWFLEKATEIGIDEITPFYSEHSERVNLRLDRLNKVLISAMKQSLKAYLPKINEPVNINEFLENVVPQEDNHFIAWLDRENTLPHLKSVCSINKPTMVLIGPEGDFSEKEVELSKKKGFIPVSLGSSRLRTETAALTACFIINLLNEPDHISFKDVY